MLQKIGVAVLLFCCAFTVFADQQTVTGVLVDQECYLKAKKDTANGGKSPQDICTERCSKLSGMKVAIVTELGDVYTVIGDYAANDNAKLVPHLCHKVILSGDVGGTDVSNLTISPTSLKMVSK